MTERLFQTISTQPSTWLLLIWLLWLSLPPRPPTTSSFKSKKTLRRMDAIPVVLDVISVQDLQPETEVEGEPEGDKSSIQITF